jgi:ribosomal protein L39E
MFAKVEVYQCFGEKTDGVTEKKSNVKVRHWNRKETYKELKCTNDLEKKKPDGVTAKKSNVKGRHWNRKETNKELSCSNDLEHKTDAETENKHIKSLSVLNKQTQKQKRNI